MGRKPKKPEAAGEGAPLWMVSFTDAMTNLLTFFILLMTFASFGDVAPGSRTASGGGIGNPSVQSGKQESRNAAQPAQESPGQHPQEGSEKPTGEEFSESQRPRAPIGILDTEAYADRKTILLPSKHLFYGWGKFLTEAGQTRLAQIAPFLRAVPCQIVIGESSADHQDNRLFNRPNVGPERALSVIQYFTEKEHLPMDRFSLAATASAADPTLNEEPVVEISLMARRVYP